MVFATMALGVGVNFVALNTIYHYGAPRTIDDFFQESGRAGRSGAQAKSVVYWKPSDAPLGGGAWERGYPTLRQKKIHPHGVIPVKTLVYYVFTVTCMLLHGH